MLAAACLSLIVGVTLLAWGIRPLIWVPVTLLLFVFMMMLAVVRS